MIRIAFKFKGADRQKSIAFDVHRAAGNAERLNAIIAGAPSEQKITQKYVNEANC
jgi:hypothetical protein